MHYIEDYFCQQSDSEFGDCADSSLKYIIGIRLGMYQYVCNLPPGIESSGGLKISTFSGVEAHMTIASDMIPLILAGFKLHSKMALRFCISIKICVYYHYLVNIVRSVCCYLPSSGMNLTKPEITVLGFSSPTSTSST